MVRHFHIKRFDPRVVWNKRHHGWRYMWGLFATPSSPTPFACSNSLERIMWIAKKRHDRYLRGKRGRT